MKLEDKRQVLENARRFFEINLSHLEGSEEAHELNMEVTELAMDYRKNFLEVHELRKEELIVGCMVGVFMYIASAHTADAMGGDLREQVMNLGATMQVNARALLELGEALMEEV